MRSQVLESTAAAAVPARVVAQRIAEYNLLALPVVDESGDILGIITVDDAMEILLPKDWRQRLPRLVG
jgi:Mg/Co/Ni transporter MgtE